MSLLQGNVLFLFYLLSMIKGPYLTLIFFLIIFNAKNNPAHWKLQPSFGTIQLTLIFFNAWLHYLDEKELHSAQHSHMYLLEICSKQAVVLSHTIKDTSISIVLHTNSEKTAVLSG